MTGEFEVPGTRIFIIYTSSAVCDLLTTSYSFSNFETWPMGECSSPDYAKLFCVRDVVSPPMTMLLLFSKQDKRVLGSKLSPVWSYDIIMCWL